MKLKSWSVFFSVMLFCCMFAMSGQVFSAIETDSSQSEGLFRNLLPEKIFRNESEIMEHMPFVAESFFGSEGLIAIQTDLESVKSILKKCRDILNENGNVFPLDNTRRQEIFGALLQKLEECRDKEREIVDTLFARSASSSSVNAIRSWQDNFENLLSHIDRDLNLCDLGENLLERFSAQEGFILEGNVDNLNGGFTSYLSIVRQVKAFPFIGGNGASLSTKDMNGVSHYDLSKILWTSWEEFGISPGFIGIIFRDSSGFQGVSENVVEFYNLRSIQQPLNIIEQSFGAVPLEIRWMDQGGRWHVMWNPACPFPFDYIPGVPVRNKSIRGGCLQPEIMNTQCSFVPNDQVQFEVIDMYGNCAIGWASDNAGQRRVLFVDGIIGTSMDKDGRFTISVEPLMTAQKAISDGRIGYYEIGILKNQMEKYLATIYYAKVK